MNCKQGDTAWVVRANQTMSLLGRLVLVVRPAVPEEILGEFVVHEGADWIIECAYGGTLPWGLIGRSEKFQVPQRAIKDMCLKPFKKPGEGEKDESLAWLPVPAKREAFPGVDIDKCHAARTAA